MNGQATARYYGRLLGMLSGLFALLQVLVSASSALANQRALDALQRSIAPPYLGSIPTDFDSVVSVLVVTYLSAAIAGTIMMGFAWYAGRITARSIGRRQFGARAGLWVAVWSGLIWLALALVATLLTHADGTLTGVLTSSRGTSKLAAQVILLTLENGLAALIGLGLGALAGLIGARTAPVAPAAPRLPLSPPYGSYLAIPGYPVLPGYWPPAAPPPRSPSSSVAYPPPPEWYQRREWTPGDPPARATNEAMDDRIPPG